ncbi:rhoptry protein [Plasmodium gonderi]|uniref:Rhoptry protein n=1 Tax=Plasmodium gonderi TaxID=77519 RepID=A0A1Y1JIT6_PLAGO|nr:rhoptry protein [Plasmodium gonderi]GAW82416.1 rhoptry protein [Plasmodium gonderi]
MHQAKKEEENKPCTPKLDFPDSASDDHVSIDKENVWDTDINIIDDEINVISDNGRDQEGSKSHNGNISDDIHMNGKRKEEQDKEIDYKHNLENSLGGIENFSFKNNHTNRKESFQKLYKNVEYYNEDINIIGKEEEIGIQNKIPLLNGIGETHDNEEVNFVYGKMDYESIDKCSPQDSEQFLTMSGREISKDNLFLNIPDGNPNGQNIMEKKYSSHEAYQKCTEESEDKNINQKNDPNLCEKNAIHLNSAGNENLVKNIKQDSSKADLSYYLPVHVVEQKNKSREDTLPREENLYTGMPKDSNDEKMEKEVAMYHGEAPEGKSATSEEKWKSELKMEKNEEEKTIIIQLRNQCEDLKNKLDLYGQRNKEHIICQDRLKSQNEQLEKKLKTYERTFNEMKEENIKNKENYEQAKAQYKQISNKCYEYETKFEKLNQVLEEKDNFMKQKEEEMKEYVERIEKDVVEKKMIIQDLEKKIEQYKKEIDEFEFNFIHKENNIRNVMEQEKRNEELMFKMQIESLENKIVHLQQELNDKEREKTQLININKELNEECTYLKMKEEENEQNIHMLKSNLQMNEKESSIKYEKIQEQSNRIDNLLTENNKNCKMIELLKNEKGKMENENDILKKDLLYLQEKLKSIEKYSYDIYEMKNYLENTLEKNKNLIEQLESEKNQKEELKNKIKLFLTEINNSAICLKLYKMKCSFFINIMRNYDKKVDTLEKKLRNHEYVKGQQMGLEIYQNLSENIKIAGKKTCSYISTHINDGLQQQELRNSDNCDHGEKKTGQILTRDHVDLIKQSLLLKEELENEKKKREETTHKVQNLLNTLKDKNLLINEKNYKLNKYKLINKNLQDSIVGYQNSIKALKENIHNLEKQIELKEVKNIVVPPKLTLHFSKLASFENNLKNELKGFIGNSSTFLESTFKYINENTLKRNLQNKAFFSSSMEKKNTDVDKGSNLKNDFLSSDPMAHATTYTDSTTSPQTSSSNNNNIGSNSNGESSLVDVTGFAKNFIYMNMNRIPNFISDQKCKNEMGIKNNSEQSGDSEALNEEIVEAQKQEIIEAQKREIIEAQKQEIIEAQKQQITETRKQDIIFPSLSRDPTIEVKHFEHLKEETKTENNNRYMDLFMGKKNLNKAGSKSDILNVQQVSQFYVNTENRIKDLFDMSKKKEANKIKEKDQNLKNVNSGENAFVPMHIFSNKPHEESSTMHEHSKKLIYQENTGISNCHSFSLNPINDIIINKNSIGHTKMKGFDDTLNYSELIQAVPSSVKTSKVHDFIAYKTEMSNILCSDNLPPYGNTKDEEKEIVKDQKKSQPSSSDEDAQVNDDVWNEKIDLESFEVEEM